MTDTAALLAWLNDAVKSVQRSATEAPLSAASAAYWDGLLQGYRDVLEYLRSRYVNLWDEVAGNYDIAQPPKNVWLGTSVEDQRRADERIPVLLATPATVRFLSIEPLLGPVTLHEFLWEAEAVLVEYIDGYPRYETEGVPTSTLHWVIVGGESGPHHRPMDLDWARRLREECNAAFVPFFYKQSSGLRSGMNPTLDGVEWHEHPGERVQPTLEGLFA